jgi:hypothetical protein
MRKDKNQDYSSMKIEELEVLMNPKEIAFIDCYEETGSSMLAAQHVGNELKNKKSASSYGCKILGRPKIIAYRRARALDLFDKRNILPETMLIRIDDLYLRSVKGKPHMKWNNVTKTHEPDGTLEYDNKSIIAALRMMGEAIGMFGKQVTLDTKQESIEEYLKRMGDEA